MNARGSLLLALVLACLPAVASAQVIPTDRFQARVFHLRDRLPATDEEQEMLIGGELLEVITALEPRVYERREQAACVTYARAAITLSGLGDFARNGVSADEWLQFARLATETVPPEERARIELEIAQQLQSDNRVDEAHQTLVAALDDFDAITLPWALTHLADIERLRGQPVDALERIETALTLLIDGHSFHEQVRVILLGLRGLVYLELGVLDEAARCFDSERAAADALNDPKLQLSVLIHSTALLLANTQEEAVAAEVDRALEQELLRDGDPTARATLFSMLGRVRADRALTTGDPDAAAACSRDLQRVLADPALPAEETTAARLSLARLFIVLDQLDETEAQLSFIETGSRARDRGLLAATRCELAMARSEAQSAPGAFDTSQQLQDLERAFEDMLTQWDQTPQRPGGIGFLHFQERLTVIDVLMRAEMRATPGEAGIREALETLIRAQARGTLVRDLGAKACDVNRVRHYLLRFGEGMLVYLPAQQRSHLFVLDASSLAYFELPAARDLEQPRREFQSLLGSPPPKGGNRDRLARLSRELSHTLIPRTLRRQITNWSALTIVGAQNLGFLPFEALDWNVSQLGLAMPIGYLPSLPLGMALLERSDSRPASVTRDLQLLIAPITDPRVQERWPTLQTIELDSLDGLLGVLPTERVDLLRGAAATPAALLQFGATPARMLHVLAHGVHDRTRERSAGLVLSGTSDDWGVVWPEVIEGMKAPELVLLSACSAARGPMRFGDDGVAHLGGAFLRAGANTVVLSRADRDLRSSYALAEKFTQALTQGTTPAGALLSARRHVAETIDDDPFFFAMLHAVGLAHQPVFAGRWNEAPAPPDRNPILDMKSPWPWIGVALSLATVAVILRARRHSY